MKRILYLTLCCSFLFESCSKNSSPTPEPVASIIGTYAGVYYIDKRWCEFDMSAMKYNYYSFDSSYSYNVTITNINRDSFAYNDVHFQYSSSNAYERVLSAIHGTSSGIMINFSPATDSITIINYSNEHDPTGSSPQFNDYTGTFKGIKK